MSVARLAAYALAVGSVLAMACGDDDPSDGGPPSPTPPIAAPVAPEIEAPQGFAVYRFAEGFHEPTALAIDHQSTLWLAERDGNIFALVDADHDGRAEPRRFASGLALRELRGIAFDDRGTLFASSRGRISVVEDADGDADADAIDDIVSGLPNGRHQNSNLVIGRDGRLYFGNGSTCNLCDERSPLSAAILSVKPDGDDLRLFAEGLRNAYGIAFAPDGNLYATENGTDPPDDPDAPDELNRIVEGGDYGWPRCSGWRALEKDGCDDTKPPLVELQRSSLSYGIVVYGEGPFPERYRGGVFIAQRGADYGDSGIGGRVVVVLFGGKAPAEEVFATGFEHPLSVAVDPAGALYVADFGTGVVYRIVYEVRP